MRRNGYFWTSGVNVDTTIRFPDPDFPLECKISAIWRRFPLIFAFYILNVRHISTSGLTYWPRKYTTRVDPHFDNSHQVWSWYDHTLPSYSVFVCWHVTWPCDLYLWPFDLEQLQCMAGHVTNLATKLDLSVLDLWGITFSIGYHWECVRGHYACAEPRDPWVRGSKTITFLVCWTPICLFTMQLRWLYDESI